MFKGKKQKIMNNKIKIFTDFDGTIAVNDVGDKLFSQYAGENWKQPIEDWEKGLISSKELYLIECAMTKITTEQMIHFCNSQQIDPHFKTFVQYCKQNHFPLIVLSDGFEYYIKQILKNHGLNLLPVIANRLIFENKNTIRPEFPYDGKGCPNCANCKGYHIPENKENGELIVYIGDGLSDRCAIEHSDIIFAKHDLKKYCLNKGVPFYEFQNFGDVLAELKDFVAKR